MTGDTPILTARDLEDELKRVHARPHRALSTAFYGRAAADVDGVTVALPDREVRFQVAEASCELEARRALSQAEDKPLVLLVSYDERLPLDVTSRLAGGKVRSVTDDRRLARLFGAKSVSSELLASPLTEALLAEGISGSGALAGATLDLDTAWRRYLERKLRLPADAPFSEERLVAHLALTGDTERFAGSLEGRPKLLTALQEHVKVRAGEVALLAWRAWLRGRGIEVAAFAFILQAAWAGVATSEYLQAWLGLRLGDLDPELANALTGRRPLLERWAGLADRLSLQFEETDLERVIAFADRLTADDRLRATLGTSRYLAGALSEGKERLAAALEGATRSPSARGASDVRSCLGAVEGHRLCHREPHASQLERARMSARLIAYLATPRERAAAVPTDVVAELALEYTREGGFVDRARSAARGPRADRLDQAIAGVVERADALRDDMDERFARALPSWLGSRKTDRVVPVDLALERFAVAFAEGGDHRRLLVLLMDGMAWANAVELALDLEDQRWGPVRWQPRGASGDLLPPMLAAIPTLTGVSRSALFAGKLMRPGESQNTALDPERFDGHKGLRKLLGHGATLLLRPEAEDRPGHASKKALDLVTSDARIVGIVVNAIDDQLKAGAGLGVAYRMQTLKALPDLLAAAAAARRAVLVVADHGHVLGDRFDKARPSVDRLSARCRELGPGENAEDGEVVFESDGAWRSKAARRLAALYRETDTYGVGSHRGEHGGASLAEVVAPALLIASDELSRSVGVADPELDLRAFPRPAWWDLEVTPSARELPALPTKKDKPEKSAKQLTIPNLTPAAPPAPREGRMAALLRASDLYREAGKAERLAWDSHVLPVVELLEEHQGTLPEDVFAARMKVLKFRVPGVVTHAAEKLNVDQHSVLAHDNVQGLVRLDMVLLEQLFGSGAGDPR